MLSKQAVIKIAKDLDFPKDQYLLFSGSSLAAYGIRPTSDVDIVVAPELFSRLKISGDWKFTNRFSNDTQFLERDDIEIASKLEWDDYPVTLSEAKSREDIIEGIPFMSLKDVIQFKQALGRDKDMKDIELIKRYLKANG